MKYTYEVSFKPHDTVYVLEEHRDFFNHDNDAWYIKKANIEYIEISAHGVYYYLAQCVENDDEQQELYEGGSFDDDEVGVYAFLSYEDAEKYAKEQGYSLSVREQ